MEGFIPLATNTVPFLNRTMSVILAWIEWVLLGLCTLTLTISLGERELDFPLKRR
ncbi:hypothetical protein MNBD_GAMMA21-893 [hydrothermal vent metagenome]|uniref:Uncharacterized protein n=1 Tax=hydrothermal vent metagenome TaxID=652676 RepID=A0A3B1AFJ9_9ZZZZ